MNPFTTVPMSDPATIAAHAYMSPNSGSGVRSLIRFCRDYMPYLFIGVIGLDRCFFYIKKSFLPISYLYKDGSGTCPCATRRISIYKGLATFHIRCSRNCQ